MYCYSIKKKLYTNYTFNYKGVDFLHRFKKYETYLTDEKHRWNAGHFFISLSFKDVVISYKAVSTRPWFYYSWWSNSSYKNVR